MTSLTRVRGFTLVEVMVALAVVAVALPALLLALSQQVDSTGYLRDKSLAALVASNKMQELRILSQSTRNLLQGKDSGVTALADRDWYWWLDSQPTAVTNFYRIEIDVAASEDQAEPSLFTLVAFLSADLRVDAAVETGTGTETETENGTESETGTEPGTVTGVEGADQ